MRNRWIVSGIMGMLVLGAGGAWSAEGERVQTASGTVVAVTPASRTIVVESKLDGKPWTVGAQATDKTKFTGKAKALTDVKAGDKVTIQFAVGESGAVLRSLTAR